MPIYEIYVRGRVQGVGFRYHARQCALRHRVTGFVRNMPDRSVYLVAQADEFVIDSFCDSLREGNSFSRVDDVHIDVLETENRYNDFEII